MVLILMEKTFLMAAIQIEVFQRIPTKKFQLLLERPHFNWLIELRQKKLS